MGLNFEVIVSSAPYVLGGLGVTAFYTVTSLVGGIFLGFFLTLLKFSSVGILRLFAGGYTSVFRGTPLLLQLAFIYYGSQNVTGYQIPVWQAGVLAFSLNSGAYVSEIMRAGVQSVDPCQYDAAYALGLSRFFLIKDIIFPQAIRNALPALVNEATTLLKDSALVSTITEVDLMRRGMVVAAHHYLYFEPLLLVAAIYYFLVLILTALGRFLEKRTSFR